jgi:hypothetical protein
MILSNDNKTLVLEINSAILNDSDFFSTYSKDAVDHDVVLSCLSISDLNDQETELINLYRNFHKEVHTTIMVATPEQYNDFPEDLVLVPTLEEAHDFIEMERIQRDLGF